MMNVKAVPDLEEIDRLVKQILYFFLPKENFFFNENGVTKSLYKWTKKRR